MAANEYEFKMSFSDLPDKGPDISGGVPRYNIGDRVNVTCLSRNSMPAAQLAWYVNGEKADAVHLRTYPDETTMDGLKTSRLGLTFKVYYTYTRPWGTQD